MKGNQEYREDNMSNLTKWDPFRGARRMQNMMSRMMGDAFLGRPWFDALDDGLVSVDVYETDENVVVKADMPGLSPDDIDLSVSGDTLSIRGESSEEREEKSEEGVQYFMRERSYRSFSRSIHLPAEVDADNAEAAYENGTLKLTLPKVEQVKAKTISIKAK